MAGKLDILLELEKRGELPEKYKPVLEELRKRGEIGPSPVTGLGYVGKGFTKGLAAHIGGLPVDITTAGINLAGAGMEKLTGTDIPGIPIERPVGGSRSISEALSGGPTLMGAPQPEEAPVSLPALTYGDISEVPSRYRAAARLGEVGGESLPFGAGLLAKAGQLAGTGRIAGQSALPAEAGTVKTGILDPLVAQAQRVGPAAFAAQEAAIATGAGVGAGIAETVAPGSVPARIGGELTGALFSPASLLINSSSRLAQSARQAVETMTPAGAEAGAARRVQDLAERFSESPGVLAEQLGAPGIPSVTAAQKTASPALTALEHKIIRTNANVGLDVARQTRAAIDEVHAAFSLLAGKGDPESLMVLARAKQDHWNNLMDFHVAQAETRLAGAAEGIKPTSPKARGEANLTVRKLLEDSLTDARAEEKRLWGRVDKNIDVPTKSLQGAYAGATDDLLEGETLNVSNKAILASIRKWAGEKAEIPSSGDMLRLRGRILAEMRRIRGDRAPDWDLHRRLDDIQIAIVDDLEGVGETALEARTFSRELHDRFSRSAAHRALGRDVRGGDVIPAELALEKTMAAKPGPERAVVAGELGHAVEPFQGLPATVRPRAMADAQEQLVRDLASSAIDPTTGRINPKSLARFRERNRDLIERFPELGPTLESAQSVTQRYGDKLRTLAKRDKTVKQEAAFKKVLSYEDPRRSLEAAMDGRFPVSDLSRIYQMARTNPEALKGATRATLDVLYKKATDATTGMISGERINTLLDEYAPTALKYGVLTESRIRRLRVVADEAAKVEASMKFGGEVAALVGDVSDIYDLALRWAGANVGGASALGQASGTSLVMAGHFSRTFRKWFEKIPATRIGDVLAEAVMDPKFMADLMSKPTTRPRIIARDRRIRAALARLGIETAQRQVFHGGVLQIAIPEPQEGETVPKFVPDLMQKPGEQHPTPRRKVSPPPQFQPPESIGEATKRRVSERNRAIKEAERFDIRHR